VTRRVSIEELQQFGAAPSRRHGLDASRRDSRLYSQASALHMGEIYPAARALIDRGQEFPNRRAGLLEFRSLPA